jgi:hypothetical protein
VERSKNISGTGGSATEHWSVYVAKTTFLSIEIEVGEGRQPAAFSIKRALASRLAWRLPLAAGGRVSLLQSFEPTAYGQVSERHVENRE